MFCSKCGKRIPDDSKFCPFCGVSVSNQWVEGTDFIVRIDESATPIKQTYKKSSKTVKLGYYDRPYCNSCKLIYGKQSIGIILKCTKCGKPLVLKSFNPYPKVIGGILILVLAISSFLIETIPIIWIGGMIWGISMISNSLSQWDNIKKLDKIKYY